MQRVTVISFDRANEETRPYRIIGLVDYGAGYPDKYLAVEFQDVFEYDDQYKAGYIQDRLDNGWEVTGQYADADGDLHYTFRRVKP